MTFNQAFSDINGKQIHLAIKHNEIEKKHHEIHKWVG